MTGTRYRRGRAYAADMAVYARLMAEDNREELSLLQRNLARALGEDVTQRQRQVLLLYYAQGLTMQEIAQELGVDRSTVSRTMLRGEERLRRTRELYFEAFRRLEGVERVAVVDGSGTQEQVAERIWAAIAPCFSGGTAE